MSSHRIFTGIVLLLFALYSHAVLSHAKIDVVTMYNGDRLTGEIEYLSGGRLSLNTDAMDRIAIEWQEISQLESRFHYEVRLSDGQRLFGSLTAGERAGQLRVAGSGGGYDLEWLDVVELRPVAGSWNERIEASVALGYSYTKAASVAQSTFRGDVSYEDYNSISALDGRVTYSDTDSSVARSSKVNLSRRNWTNRAEIYRQIYGNFEQNDQLGLEGRYVAGAGLGKYWIDTHGMHLSSTGGLQVLTERNERSDKQESVEVALTVDFSIWRFATPELSLDTTLSVFPSLTESGRTRASGELVLRWELIKDLFWDVSAWSSFDNRSESDRNIDYGVSTGIGWSY